MVNKIIFVIAIAALAMVGGCTKGDQTSRNENAGTDSKESVMREQPGQVSPQTEKEKGHGEVAVQKETVTTERKTEKERIPTVEEKAAKADINRMEKDDFMALGLSEQEAKNIVQYRKDHGNFSSVDQLKNVPGLNQAWLSRHASHLGIS